MIGRSAGVRLGRAAGRAQRDGALGRWRVLRPHLEDGVPLPRAAGEAGVALRTAQRWLTRYRAGGLAALARAARADRGTRRQPEELRLLIEGQALRRPGPSAAHVHRVLVDVAAEQGWPVPSYATVYAVIRGIAPAMRTLSLDSLTKDAETPLREVPVAGKLLPSVPTRS